EAAEHAVAVVAGKRQLGGAGDAHEAGVAALVGAIGPPFGVGGGEEEELAAPDEFAVLGGELGSAELLVEAIGEPPGIVAVLQLAHASVVELAHGVEDSTGRCALRF